MTLCKWDGSSVYFCPKWRLSPFGSASEAVTIVFLLLIAASAAFQSPIHTSWCPALNLLLPSEKPLEYELCVRSYP
jgi:hypothetical protein